MGMKSIHIYFTSGSELMANVTEEEAKTILGELSYPSGTIEIPHPTNFIVIPITAIERIEIEK